MNRVFCRRIKKNGRIVQHGMQISISVFSSFSSLFFFLVPMDIEISNCLCRSTGRGGSGNIKKKKSLSTSDSCMVIPIHRMARFDLFPSILAYPELR